MYITGIELQMCHVSQQLICACSSLLVSNNLWIYVGRLACQVYGHMRREAATVKIQKHTRRYQSKKSYKKLHYSALVLQTGLRSMAARKEFRFRKRSKAAIIIQVLLL